MLMKLPAKSTGNPLTTGRGERRTANSEYRQHSIR
jgi:hypothetical protein